MPWNIISESVLGASHKRKGMPLQDAVMSMLDRDFLYVAIADGHGSNLCFRSDVGASLAVLSAIEIIQHQARNIAEIKSREGRELSLRNVLQAISAHWARLAMKHLRSNPFQATEIDSLTQRQQKFLSTNALLAYGSTLSLAVLNRKNVFGFCLGDGDALFKLKNKVELLDSDREAVGDATHSICQIESITKARFFEYDSKLLDCFMIATDGYKNSFESAEDFKQVIEDMHRIWKSSGASTIKKNFAEWLDETSIKGSGDDISACFLYNEAYSLNA
ncbi:MAG: protein phosphatase 2C domain-containing protein [Bacillota bacterium]|nr:protein phosphatase 2C domain-containing protein [Bacillota bacterium]